MTHRSDLKVTMATKQTLLNGSISFILDFIKKVYIIKITDGKQTTRKNISRNNRRNIDYMKSSYSFVRITQILYVTVSCGWLALNCLQNVATHLSHEWLSLNGK